MSRIIVFLLLTPLFIITPAGAQYNPEDAVININGGEITVTADDFYRHLEGASGTAEGGDSVDLDTFDDAKKFAEDIVKARAIVAEARKGGYPSEKTASDISENTNRLLKGAAEKAITSEIEVSEEEINDYYAKMDYSLKVAIIINNEEKPVREAYSRLKKGEDFGDMAAEYNENEELKKERGVLKQLIPFNLDPSVAGAFALEKLWDYTEPMELRNGQWIIVQVREKVSAFTEENPKPPLEDVREWIKNKYVTEKSIDYVPEFLDRELESVEIWRDDDLYEKGMTWDKSRIESELRGKGLVVARVGNVDLLFDDWWPYGDFKLMSDEEWAEKRSSENNGIVKHLEKSYEVALVRTKLVYWALLNGLDKDKDLAWEIWRFGSEKTLNEYVEKDLTPLLPHPPEEEIQAYFDEHHDEYVIKESLNGRIYLFDTKEEADKYRAMGDLPEYIPSDNLAPDELIVKISEDYGLDSRDEDYAEKIGKHYIIYRSSRKPDPTCKLSVEVSPELEKQILDIAYESEIHAYSPVFEMVDGRYGFVWNRFLTPFRYKDYDEVHDSIYNSLNEKYITTPEAEKLVDDWINNIYSKYQYELNEDVARVVFDAWHAGQVKVADGEGE